MIFEDAFRMITLNFDEVLLQRLKDNLVGRSNLDLLYE